MKALIGIILAISAAALAVLSFMNPAEYDTVGQIVKLVSKPPFELHWLIAVVIMLAVVAFDAFAVGVTAESNIVSLIGIIAFAATTFVISILCYFEIYPPVEYSVWYNVIPLAILFISLIVGILNSEVTIPEMLLTFAGYATAGFAGAFLAALLIAIFSFIIVIVCVGVLLIIVGAALGGR